MTLRESILRPGDRTRASGLVFGRERRVGINLDKKRFGFDRSSSLGHAPSIELIGSSITHDFDRWKIRWGCIVSVSGEWDGAKLRVDDEVVVIDADLPAVSRPAAVVAPAEPLSKSTTALAAVIGELRDEGSLISFHTENSATGQLIGYAAVTDESRVDSRLRPAFNGRLTLIRSTWDKPLYDALQATILASPPGIRSSFGTRQTPERQLRLAATITHLPEEYALALAPYPQGAFDLEILLLPER